MMVRPRIHSIVQWLLFLSVLEIYEQARIVAVIDQTMVEQNQYLVQILERSSTVGLTVEVVVSDQNNSISTLETVCGRLHSDTAVIVDMSQPEVGHLLRSFARANGLIYMPIMDESMLLPVDRQDPSHLQIEPPAFTMLQVISDMVTYENLTNAVILYDESFNLNEAPRRIISGVTSHHIYQQLHLDEEAISELIFVLKELDVQNIFIIGNTTSIDYVLGKASHFDSLRDNYNWFTITKDALITCSGCRLQMSAIIVDGDFTYVRMEEYITFMKRTFNKPFNSNEIKVDEAFAYDLATILQHTVPPYEGSVQNRRCYDNQYPDMDASNLSQLIAHNFKQVKHDGVFGKISYENGALRQRMTLNLWIDTFQNGKSLRHEQLGTWTETNGLNISQGSLVQKKSQKIYRVVIVPEYPPFIYRHVTPGNSSLITYSGFCIDLLKEVAKHSHFEYELYESPDKFFGSLNADGSWNGAINELIQKNADIAVGPISVMSERENVVDFTVPFHEPVGLNILRKKHKFEYSLHRFLSVLKFEVWGCTVAAFFIFSVLMWLFDRFSPYSYQNTTDRAGHGEKRIFTLKEGIWFCMTSLTPQGGGEAPRALSGRLVAATWWLFGFLLIAFYTANLAAFLTVTRLETQITSLEDLSKQRNIKYGPLNGTSALVYFQRMENIENQFYGIWKSMSLNDSLNPVERANLAVWDYPVSEKFTELMESMVIMESSEQARTMVASGDFNFINDATRNRYEENMNCDVEAYGEEFSRKPFAFAVPQGSSLRGQLSTAILDLTNDRILESLTTKWWHATKKDCPRIEDESDGITIKNIGGVFLVIAVGTGFSFILLGCEFYFYKYKPMKEAKLYSINKRKYRKRASSGGEGKGHSRTKDQDHRPENGRVSSVDQNTSRAENRNTNGFLYGSNSDGLPGFESSETFSSIFENSETNGSCHRGEEGVFTYIEKL